MQSLTLKARVVRSDEGRPYPNPEGTLWLKIPSADAGGQFSVNVADIRPGGGPPPHVHTREDELFYVIEGEFEFLVGDSIVSAGPGDFVFGVREVPHTFRNVGEKTGRLLNVATGSNFDAFYEKYSELTSSAEPDFAALKELAADYGIQVIGGPA